MTVEKTVFISYRRDGGYYTALNIFQNLRARGYDVFFDYESIDSGEFDQIILNQIRARAHFLIVLHANTLIKCNQPGDWVRREIETAMHTKRNIIPVTFPDFDWNAAQPYLTGKLAILGGYNALKIPEGYFEAAMDKLVNRYLNVDTQLTQPAEQDHVRQLIDSAAAMQQLIDSAATMHQLIDSASATAMQQLRAQQKTLKGIATWLGKKVDDLKGQQEYALTSMTDYNDRGITRYREKDYDGAIDDYNEAIRLDPDYAAAYNNRGNAHQTKRDYDSAITDYNEAIRLDPNYAIAYYNRSFARRAKGDINDADADLIEARRLGLKV